MMQNIPHQKVKFDDQARDKISIGVDLLADAVQTTLGPGGRHVAFEPAPGMFAVTKDGVTVAKSIQRLDDPFENIGAQLVRQAAQQTAEVAGDGTTTATVLARAIFNEGKKAIAAGRNIVGVRHGIEKAVDYVTKYIDKHAKPCVTEEELIHVATISANADAKLGQMIAKAKYKLGTEAVIAVERGRKAESVIEYVDGLRYEEGFASPYFVTNQRSMRVEYENPYIMIVDYKVKTLRDLTEILNEVLQTGRPILMLLNSYDPEVLNFLATNNMQGKLRVCATHFPLGFDEDGTELSRDIAALTGGMVLSENTGVDVRGCKLEDLGTAKRVIVTRTDTTIIGGGGTKKAISTRVDQIKDLMEKTSTCPVAEKMRKYLQERIAKLSGGVAIIRAGGSSEMEMMEARDRIEDAVFAVQAASEDGIVPGGGQMYLKALPGLAKLKAASDDEAVGIQIVASAIQEPFIRIVTNAGYDSSYLLASMKHAMGKAANLGYNAATGELCNLVKAGVIDPAKVVKVALKNAASVATLLLTTEAVVVTHFTFDKE